MAGINFTSTFLGMDPDNWKDPNNWDHGTLYPGDPSDPSGIPADHKAIVTSQAGEPSIPSGLTLGELVLSGSTAIDTLGAVTIASSGAQNGNLSMSNSAQFQMTTGDVTCAGSVAMSGGLLAMGTSKLKSTGDMTLAGSITWSSGAKFETNGSFDNSAATSWSNTTANTLTMTGMSKTIKTGGLAGNDLYSFVGTSGSVIDQIVGIDFNGPCIFDGVYSIPSGQILRGINNSADVAITSNGHLTGPGTLSVVNNAGISAQSGILDCNILNITDPHNTASNSIASGTYGSAQVNMGAAGSSNVTFAFEPGAYHFLGNVTLETAASGTATLDNATNDANITIDGSFNTIDGGGNITMNMGDGTWTFASGIDLSGVTSFSKDNSSMVFSGAGSGIQNITTNPHILGHTTMNDPGATKNLPSSISTTGFVIGSGTTLTNTSIFSVTSSAEIDIDFNADISNSLGFFVSSASGATVSNINIDNRFHFYVTTGGPVNMTDTVYTDELALINATGNVSTGGNDLFISGQILTIADVFNQSSGTVYYDGNDLNLWNLFNGTSISNLVSTTPSGEISITNDLTILGNLTVQSGSLIGNGSSTLNIAGNLDVQESGSLVTSGPIVFNGSGLQTIKLSDNDIFDIDVIKSSGTLMAIGDIGYHSIAVQSGEFDDGGFNITGSGSINISAGNVSSSGVWTQTASGTIQNPGFKNNIAHLIMNTGSIGTHSDAFYARKLTLNPSSLIDGPEKFFIKPIVDNYFAIDSSADINNNGLIIENDVDVVNSGFSVSSDVTLSSSTGNISTITSDLNIGNFFGTVVGFFGNATLNIKGINIECGNIVTNTGTVGNPNIIINASGSNINANGDFNTATAFGQDSTFDLTDGTMTTTGDIDFTNIAFIGDNSTVNASGIVKTITSDGVTFNNLNIDAGIMNAFDELDVDGNFKTFLGGQLSLDTFSVDMTCAGDLDTTQSNSNGGISAGSQKITIDGSGTSIISTHSSDNFYDLFLAKQSTTILDSDIVVDSELNIGSGNTLDVSIQNYDIVIKGLWTNSGTFIPQSGEIIVANSGQVSVFAGDTTFYDVRCVSPGKQIDWTVGDVFTFVNELMFAGSESNDIKLRSTIPGSGWNMINNDNPAFAIFVDVQDSQNTGINIRAFESEDSGNNIGWIFVADDRRVKYLGFNPGFNR